MFNSFMIAVFSLALVRECLSLEVNSEDKLSNQYLQDITSDLETNQE